MNLATARFAHRSREVGIRKVLGSRRNQLVAQFLGESLLLSLIALVLALGLIALLLPAFGRLLQRPLVFGDVLSGGFPAFLAGVVLAVGLGGRRLPGVLSVLVRSPDDDSRGGSRSGERARSATAGARLRSVRRRLRGHLRDRGHLPPDGIISTAGTWDSTGTTSSSSTGPTPWGHSADAFETELLARPGHPEGLAERIPARPPFRLHGASARRDAAPPMSGRYGRLTWTSGSPISSGSSWPPAASSPGTSRRDATSAVVINERAARELGLSDPVGKRLHKNFGGAEPGEFVTIIGVLKDFHFASLHRRSSR